MYPANDHSRRRVVVSSIRGGGRVGRSELNKEGELIFMYSCTHNIKTMDFKRNELCAEHE